MTILNTLHQTFTSITADSRQVKAGALFLAYPGAVSDGVIIFRRRFRQVLMLWFGMTPNLLGVQNGR